eukprot:NODE_1077_length_1406_cov_0.174445.p1 type:complete len:277 gc:universal NODE_1077_length_1406_cov_0.174445:301-1131(+)
MSTQPKKKSLSTHLIAGGVAGFSEAAICHPLDTIKVRMQLRSKQKIPMPFYKVGYEIAKKEGIPGLYKGIGAVVTGIVPKIALRFGSFEAYKEYLGGNNPASWHIFVAGLGAGVTESILVVNPMEVIKIRLQAQRHSLSDPMDIPKYRNAAHCAYTIAKEEGFSAFYKGVSLTCLRQATNQAVNFTIYTKAKAWLLDAQKLDNLPSYQSLLLGGFSGALGPMSNAPIDTIKTRIQRSRAIQNESATARISRTSSEIYASGGFKAFYRGITPRSIFE